MGDRIAVLQEGGKLAQYATPAELLMAPADEFVEDFVGADRALKRLALLRVADIDLWEAPLALRRPVDRRGAGEARGRRGPAPAAGRLRAPAARLALRARPRSATRARAARHARRADPRPRRRDARRALRPAPGRDPVRARSSTARAGSRACSRSRSSPSSSARPRRSTRSTRPRSGRWGEAQWTCSRCSLLAQSGDGFVTRPRPRRRPAASPRTTRSASAGRSTTSTATSTPTLEHLAPGRGLGRGRVRDRAWAGGALAPPPLADPAVHGSTGVLYTIPSIALFLLLLPITGRGHVTAIIALTLYTLQILYRNIVTGLAQRPGRRRTRGAGMGMSDRQLLWRVELPLAMPEIIAGLRIATVSTVAIATLAVFAGAGGLGEEIYTGGSSIDVFRTGDRGRRRIAIADGDRLRRPAAGRRPAVPRALATGEAGMSDLLAARGRLLDPSAARSSSSSSRSRRFTAGGEVGGLDQVLATCWTHIWRSAPRRSRSRSSIALPDRRLARPPRPRRGAGGRGRQRGPRDPRAGPDRVHGRVRRRRLRCNVTIALVVLGIPPILTNAFVGIRQVDRDAVEAARGMGMTELEVVRRVELPLAVPTIMSGVRTGAINIIATATIAPLAGVDDARRLHHQPQRLRRRRACSRARSWSPLLALTVELVLAGLQRLLTPRGLELERERRPSAALIGPTATQSLRIRSPQSAEGTRGRTTSP